jgi:hypothetical protein
MKRIFLVVAWLFGACGLTAPALAGPVLPQVTLPAYFPAASDDGRFGLLLWQAQSCEDCGYEDDGPGKGKPKIRYGTNLNKGTTNDLVRILLHANDTCDERIERRYRVDCLRIYYGWAADLLPDSGDYLDIKKALRKAEKQLSAIVSKNVDREAPVITPREGHRKSAKKMPPLRAVKPAAEKKAIAQAEAVVKETELVILRSGEDPDRRTAHFSAVAEAVDSNLVVLRSA